MRLLCALPQVSPQMSAMPVLQHVYENALRRPPSFGSVRIRTSCSEQFPSQQQHRHELSPSVAHQCRPEWTPVSPMSTIPSWKKTVSPFFVSFLDPVLAEQAEILSAELHCGRFVNPRSLRLALESLLRTPQM